ncbi:MAG TPA: hypothetical protein VMM15_30650 [Bradyrhizobium sp.]|nr:hypothetical protein [Bradyrhizobium sp.]
MSVHYLRPIARDRITPAVDRIDAAAEIMLATAPLLRAAARSLRRSAAALEHEAEKLSAKPALFCAAKARLIIERTRALEIARSAAETERRIRSIIGDAAPLTAGAEPSPSPA